MEQLTQIIDLKTLPNVSNKEFEDALNRKIGTLTGCDCKECLNRGYFWRVDQYDIRSTVTCKCMTVRKNLMRMEKSGLGSMLSEYTFDTFLAKKPWQIKAFDTVNRYEEAGDAWLYISGQTGSGKTHLCTALVGNMLKSGTDVQYMRWVEDSQRMKYGEFGARNKKIDALQTCKVLYIDDFLKAAGGFKTDVRGLQTDIRLAFEILNVRYSNRLRTIISSEYYLDEITAMDEALGSRIAHRAKGFNIPIRREAGRNWRLGAGV